MATQKHHWPIEDMRRWYEEEGLTMEEIAIRLGWTEARKRAGAKLVYKIAKKHGFATRRRGPKDGPGNPQWKGGRLTDKSGYILILRPDHPLANSGGYVREHRLVAEGIIGRHLTPTEVVHHKDDDPANNDPSNLVVYETNGKHLAETLAGKCPNWTEEGVARIAASKARGRLGGSSRIPSEPDGPA